jgi:hypothetical protein
MATLARQVDVRLEIERHRSHALYHPRCVPP